MMAEANENYPGIYEIVRVKLGETHCRAAESWKLQLELRHTIYDQDESNNSR